MGPLSCYTGRRILPGVLEEEVDDDVIASASTGALMNARETSDPTAAGTQLWPDVPGATRHHFGRDRLSSARRGLSSSTASLCYF
jgi:hypothetical protein